MRKPGSRRCTSASVRQSKLWIITRRVMPAARIAARSVSTNTSGETVSFGRCREDLGLDVELHVVRAELLDQREQRRQRRDALAVDRLLRRERLAVGELGVEAADVVALHLGERQRADQRARLLQPAAIGVARRSRIERRLVRDDGDAVGGDADVELERCDAHADRVLERGERVLRAQAPAAAVRLQVERERRRREGDGEAEGEERAKQHGEVAAASREASR